MARLTIDGRSIEVPDGTSVLDAARQAGIEIPALCHEPGCEPLTTCFVCVVRIDGAARLQPSCATRARDGMVVESETEAVREARRVALELLLSEHLGDCVGPCQSVCPAHMEIPVMIRQLGAGEWREAIRTVKRHIALPATLGRICPELCEKGCRRGELDRPVSICRLKRWAADRDLASAAPYLPECRPETGKRVAIVGAGPAGLAAAWQLRQDGHGVALFDAQAELGGCLLTGVEESRLPRDVLRAEIGVILRLGVERRSGVQVGRDLSLAALRREFDAVLLAIGETTAEAAAGLGVAFAGNGLVVDPVTGQTPCEGVFAAGSAASPSPHAIRAVASGRRAALNVSAFLGGARVDEPDRPYTVHIGRLHECEISRVRREGSDAVRVIPAGGDGAGFTDPEGHRETGRCLHCDCLKLADCALRKYAAAYGAKPRRFAGTRREYLKDDSHATVVFEPGKCIDCGRCVVRAAKAGEPLGLTFKGRGFDVRLGVPFDRPLAAGLVKAAEACADACPTAALARRDQTPDLRARG